MTKKTSARLNRGFRDIFSTELATRWHIIDAVRQVYQRWGYKPLETPALEYVEVLGKFLPESQTPEGGIFAFRNEDDEWVALRYDLTAPLSRVVAQYRELQRPFKRYQFGPVWRLEKPGPGRFREFYQLDFDAVGCSSMAADAEVAMIICQALEAVGIAPGEYRVRINNRKILAGVLERAGIGQLQGGDDDGQAMTVLRAIDKLDRIGLAGVRELLGKGRMDQSGDYTRGAELSPGQIDMVMSFLEAGSDSEPSRQDVCTRLAELVGEAEIGRQGVRELEHIEAILSALEFDEGQIIFDPTVVRGLAYYTGPVIEGELTFPVIDEKGRERSFGSVYGGGRYDDLVTRFTGQAVPATGASIGVDRLAAALAALGREVGDPGFTRLLITAMDKSRFPEYYRMAESFRRAGINTEVFTGNGGLRKQLKYADKLDIPLALIAGEDELGRGVVQIKNLRRGRELAADISERQQWLEQQPAQQEVGRDRMIQTVVDLLAPSTRA